MTGEISFGAELRPARVPANLVRPGDHIIVRDAARDEWARVTSSHAGGRGRWSVAAEGAGTRDMAETRIVRILRPVDRGEGVVDESSGIETREYPMTERQMETALLALRDRADGAQAAYRRERRRGSGPEAAKRLLDEYHRFSSTYEQLNRIARRVNASGGQWGGDGGGSER